MLEFETLTGDEIKKLCSGKKINPIKKKDTKNDKNTPKAKNPTKKRAGIPISAPTSSIVTNEKNSD